MPYVVHPTTNLQPWLFTARIPGQIANISPLKYSPYIYWYISYTEINRFYITESIRYIRNIFRYGNVKWNKFDSLLTTGKVRASRFFLWFKKRKEVWVLSLNIELQQSDWYSNPRSSTKKSNTNYSKSLPFVKHHPLSFLPL